MSDLKALSAKFLAKRTALLAYCYGLMQERASADDLFQEVYLKLAEACERGDEIHDLERWCRGTARNLALHYWRSRRTTKVVFQDEILDLIDQGFDEQESVLNEWDHRKNALQECAQRLGPESRRMMELKYVEELSVRDISSRLKRTPEAVMQALYRVRRALQECISTRLKMGGTGA